MSKINNYLLKLKPKSKIYLFGVEDEKLSLNYHQLISNEISVRFQIRFQIRFQSDFNVISNAISNAMSKKVQSDFKAI